MINIHDDLKYSKTALAAIRLPERTSYNSCLCKYKIIYSYNFSVFYDFKVR
jgi:hypothetical protein